jgi:hypothetical protein
MQIPDRIGPVELEQHGRLIAVRCPSDFADLLRRAGAQWDRGGRIWWIQQHRAGRLIRNLEARVDPLFRAAGLEV